MKISTRHLIYLTCVGLIALLIAPLFSYAQLSWFFPATFLFAISLPFVWERSNALVILLTGFVAALLIALVSVTREYIFITACIMFVVTLISVNLSFRYPRYFYLMQGVNVLIIFATFMLPVNMAIYLQIYPIIAASCLVAICQVIFLPRLTHGQQQAFTVGAIKKLHAVAKDIFSCFVQQEYADNMYLFEHRLHLAKANFFEVIAALDVNDKHYRQLQIIFDILMNIAQLRRRVTDFHIFSVCEREMLAIAVALDDVFTAMRAVTLMSQEKIDAYPLEEKITQFANHYQAILNVAAKEPLAFLLFIASLNHLCKEVENYV